jgi:hypothetical protein
VTFSELPAQRTLSDWLIRRPTVARERQARGSLMLGAPIDGDDVRGV